MASFALADIELVSRTQPELYVAAENITAGNLYYLDSNGQAAKADASAATTDEIAGVALQDAVTGNYVVGIPTGATIQVSNVLVATSVLILSSTAGQVMLESDLLATEYLSVFGTAITTAKIVLRFNNTETVKA